MNSFAMLAHDLLMQGQLSDDRSWTFTNSPPAPLSTIGNSVKVSFDQVHRHFTALMERQKVVQDLV